MTTIDFITELFCRVDDQMGSVRKHAKAVLWPSQSVTLGLRHALKGVGNRACYRWLMRDYRVRFPHLPERTGLSRLFKTHQAWRFMFRPQPILLGIVDSFGIELIHPSRAGRSRQQIGRKGVSNHRWIVGGKLCLVINHWGGIAGWGWAPANPHESWFHPIIEGFQRHRVVLAAMGFHAKTGEPANLKLCHRGECKDRMLLETVLSMLTQGCHFKKVRHRVADYFQSRLAFPVALFNVLVQWQGWKTDEAGFVDLSIAEFSL